MTRRMWWLLAAIGVLVLLGAVMTAGGRPAPSTSLAEASASSSTAVATSSSPSGQPSGCVDADYNCLGFELGVGDTDCNRRHRA